MKKYIFYSVFIPLSACSPEPETPPAEHIPEEVNVLWEFEHTFDERTLAMNVWEVTAPGDSIRFSRLDYLMSSAFMIQEDGDTIYAVERNSYACNKAGNGNATWDFGIAEEGSYLGIGFTIGLEDGINKGNPNFWPANHPLNPVINGLHWGWADGYVFVAMEGRTINPDNGNEEALLLHIAFEKNRTAVYIDQPFEIDGNSIVDISLMLDKVFTDPNEYRPSRDGNFTHSSDSDGGLSTLVSGNIKQSFEIEGVRPQ